MDIPELLEGGCGDVECGTSCGIHDPENSLLSGLTFGKGELDDFGYWEEPCFKCARAFEKAHPSATPCWPFDIKIEEVEVAPTYFCIPGGCGDGLCEVCPPFKRCASCKYKDGILK